MATEIERKFLLANESWREHVKESRRIRQGYLAPLDTSSVRVRIDGDKANINIKSATIGISRKEFEYPVPVQDAIDMLDNLCQQPQVDKIRHFINHDAHLWEIDEFLGDNKGLIVAEVELDSVDEAFTKPHWVAEEVSEDPRYYNVNLAQNPYKNW